MPEYSKFNGTTEIGTSLFIDNVETNIVKFLEWGLLGIGAFFNVRVPSSGAYGGNQERLRLSSDRNFTSGRVWEGFRGNWVYESGIEYSKQPIAISGLYVNNTFYNTATTGAFAYKIDYPYGRIIFNSAISTTGVVKLEYSYKYYNVYTADVPWFREIMYNSFRVDDSQFLQSGSGQWAVMKQKQVQLPAIVVEAIPRRNMRGFQLGGGHYFDQDLDIFIFAETKHDRDKILDIMSYQIEKTIYLFDKNTVRNSGVFPLQADGTIKTSGLMYKDMVNPDSSYFWRKARFTQVDLAQMDNIPHLYTGMARTTLEVEMPNI